MSGPDFGIGAVIHIKDFVFEDGSKANKYFIVLGSKPGSDYLCVKTTSHPWKRGFTPGCHHIPRTYFFIPGGGEKTYFPKDTWVILSEPKIFSAVALIQGKLDGTITVEANFDRNVTGQIRNCLKASKDVSKLHLELM